MQQMSTVTFCVLLVRVCTLGVHVQECKSFVAVVAKSSNARYFYCERSYLVRLVEFGVIQGWSTCIAD